MSRWIQSFEVPSTSGPGTYVVSRDKQGVYACSCPHFIYRRGACKHIRTVQEHARTAPTHPVPPTCIAANVCAVTAGENNTVLVPLLPIGHTDFLATMIVDLLLHRVPFDLIRRHYHLPKHTSRQDYIDHVLSHGRYIYAGADGRFTNRYITHTDHWQLPEPLHSQESPEAYHHRTGAPLDLVRIAVPRAAPTESSTTRSIAPDPSPPAPHRRYGQRRIILPTESETFE